MVYCYNHATNFMGFFLFVQADSEEKLFYKFFGTEDNYLIFRPDKRYNGINSGKKNNLVLRNKCSPPPRGNRIRFYQYYGIMEGKKTFT